jgi:hypothetical protein
MLGQHQLPIRRPVVEVHYDAGGEIRARFNPRFAPCGLPLSHAGFGILLPVIDAVDEFPGEPQRAMPGVIRRAVKGQNRAARRRHGMEERFGRVGAEIELPDDLAIMKQGQRAGLPFPDKADI